MAVSLTADGGRPAELSVSSLEMTGCKEATIGTRVDLRGDFVVNQFLRFDNTPPPEELSAIRNALVKDTRKKARWEKLPVRSLALGLLMAIVLSGGIVATTLLVKSGTGDVNDDDPVFGTADIDTLPMNFTYRLRSRIDWGAREPNAEMSEIWDLPARYVLLAHTAGRGCDLPIICEKLVLSIQQKHINQKLRDIGYNFIIGGDGYIYEGRGWEKSGEHTYEVNCASIGVAFIGNFDALKLKRKMKNALDLLVEEGVRLEQLDSNYKFLAQSQFSILSTSPGLHVEEQMKRWENYDVLADLDTLPMSFTYRLRSRSDWDAREPEADELKELYERPAGYVVVAHTATGSCDLPVFCENLILSIQQDHVNQNLGDIGYNFLIGGDGCIYEGRGWGMYGAHTYGVNCASIGVAFIGNFDVMKLKRKMTNAFDLLIEEGVMLGEIKPNYTLLAQSQVLITDSPGLNIKKQIKRWKNYGKIKGNVC